MWTVDREVSEGSKNSSGTCQGTSCVIFGQESSFVWPVFLRRGLKFKYNGLICLVDESSGQENFQAVAEDVSVSVNESNTRANLCTAPEREGGRRANPHFWRLLPDGFVSKKEVQTEGCLDA